MLFTAISPIKLVAKTLISWIHAAHDNRGKHVNDNFQYTPA